MDLDIHHSHAVSADNRGLPPPEMLQRFHNLMELSGLTDLYIILMTTPGMYRFRNAQSSTMSVVAKVAQLKESQGSDGIVLLLRFARLGRVLYNSFVTATVQIPTRRLQSVRRSLYRIYHAPRIVFEAS